MSSSVGFWGEFTKHLRRVSTPTLQKLLPRGCSLVWGGKQSFWGPGPERRTVRKTGQQQFRMRSAATAHLRQAKQSPRRRHRGHLFKRVGWTEASKGSRTCAIRRREWHRKTHHPFPIATTLQLRCPHPPSLQPVLFPPVHRRQPPVPAAVLRYWPFQGSVL